MTNETARDAWVTWFIALCDSKYNSPMWNICWWHLDWLESRYEL